MSKQLQGKTAFITGASRGIGYAIATKFAEQGCNIAFTHLSNLEQEHALVHNLRALGVQVQAYHSDAANFSEVHKVIEATIEQFGSLDILVNNAGITRDNLLLRMDEQAWDEVIRVNLKSVFNTVKAATKIFLRQRQGSIINITSIVGIKGNIGQSNYAASKAGIIGFTKSVALELASRNIRSNAIAPGFIHTAMTENLINTTTQAWLNTIPLQRMGTPEDVANCALFLASDSSSYITGQVIQVDGGMLT
jgi:3-oxoacyl-[acyl-carrier protein] reductase